MIVELGHYALILALSLALVQSVLPALGARNGDARLMETGTITASAGFLLLAFSFSALMASYVTSDFSVLNVFENSNSAQPLLYKFTSTWGNHEGSMLLWVLILGFFGSLVALFGRDLPASLKANVLSVQAWITTAFLLFILTTSNPFERLVPAPMEGRDLNPILQDIGLAVHPPMLYLGYVGFSIAFSFAVAALIDGRIDAAWARWVRPWTLIAWIFLTCGIAMGSYWSYYELGWGGWWFWDPVENASFMPWLCGTALLHSALVMEKRAALKVWTILLAILTFSLSLLGTFLVRSGVLTSVHAFATDPSRGIFILVILCVFIGGSLALFAARGSSLEPGGLFAPISREGALVFNNLFLTTAAATVLVGTLYPLVLETLGGAKISVGPPFFDLTFGPLMIPLLFAVPFGPLLAWKRADLLAAAQRLYFAVGAAMLAVIVVIAFTSGTAILASLGFGLAVWLMAGSLTDLCVRSGFGRAGFRTGLVAPERSAALGLRHRLRPFRARRHRPRHRRSDRLPDRTGDDHEAGRHGRGRRLRTDLPGHGEGERPELRGAGRHLRRHPERPGDRGHPKRQALLSGATDADDGSRHPHQRLLAALRLARRSRGERRLDGRADLVQAAGDADLVRRAAHGVRRHRLARRPATADRCAGAQPQARGRRRGGLSR